MTVVLEFDAGARTGRAAASSDEVWRAQVIQDGLGANRSEPAVRST